MVTNVASHRSQHDAKKLDQLKLKLRTDYNQFVTHFATNTEVSKEFPNRACAKAWIELKFITQLFARA
jgi:hypothetical protein